MQARVRQVDMRGELVPERDHEIFRRGDDAAQEIDFVVQVAVVARVDDHALEELFQFGEIHEVAGHRIGRAAERDFEHVVVAVPVRIGAEAVLPLVPREALGRVVEPVRGVEMHLPRNGHDALLRADRGDDGFFAGGGFAHGAVKEAHNAPRVNCAAPSLAG